MCMMMGCIVCRACALDKSGLQPLLQCQRCHIPNPQAAAAAVMELRCSFDGRQGLRNFDSFDIMVTPLKGSTLQLHCIATSVGA
jgi:hypothetical protein